MSKLLKRYLLICSLACIAPSFVLGQVKDAGLWTSINLEKKLSKKLSLHFTEEFRFYENITELASFFSELSAEYRYNKIFSFSAGYRFTQRRQVDDSYSTRHRYMINLTMKNKLEALSASVRIRYQSQYTDVQSSEMGMVPENYLRPKLTLKYDFGKKYTPYISGELFFHLNRPDGILMDNYRVAAGLEYDFSKRSSIDLGYLINSEVQVADPWTNYVINIGWNYILK